MTDLGISDKSLRLYGQEFRLALIFSVLTLLFTSCSGSKKEKLTSEDMQAVFNDVRQIEQLSGKHKNPIRAFRNLAEESADEIMELDKNNIAQAIHKIGKYKHAILVVDDHTIVQIPDAENCQQSGSWNECMPYGMGYIKRGKLDFEEGYINNIIGKPDMQQRQLFLLGAQE